MGITFPNQKKIVIHRDGLGKNFLGIQNEHWMKVNKKHGPFALQLYLYLAKNADGYPFALSQQAALKEVGITKTTFHKYVNLLIDEGYLVHRNGNTYDFYETPQKQENKDLKRPPYGKSAELQQEQKNLSHESRSSSDSSIFPQFNKEIYIKDNKNNIDNQQIETIIQQQKERTNIAEEPEQGYIF